MQSTSVSTDGNETFKPVNDSVNYHLHGADFIRATGCRQSAFLFTIRHGKNFLFLSLYSFLQKVCFYKTPETTAQADSLADVRKYADMYLLKASLSEKRKGHCRLSTPAGVYG